MNTKETTEISYKKGTKLILIKPLNSYIQGELSIGFSIGTKFVVEDMFENKYRLLANKYSEIIIVKECDMYDHFEILK